MGTRELNYKNLQNCKVARNIPGSKEIDIQLPVEAALDAMGGKWKPVICGI
jgi:DNA-binding HxlR family transcriptional regulator